MKTVVITGCAGFIGSMVTQQCLNMGWRVFGIDKFTYAANRVALESFNEYENFAFIEADICKIDRLPDCDYIINTAAESHVGNSIIDSSNFVQTNVEGVRNLLDLVRRKPDNIVSKPVFLHFSTDEVYGDGLEYATEESSLNPSNPYSASKAAADLLIQAWHRTYDIDYVIVRPSNNYGPNQYPEKLIPLSVKLLQRGKKIRLHDKGEPTRTWLHTYDTATAILTIIEKEVKNEVFNIAGNIEQKNVDTVRKIIKAYYKSESNWEEKIDLDYKRQGQDARYNISDEKLKSYGWKPVMNFDEQIERLVDGYKRNFVW